MSLLALSKLRMSLWPLAVRKIRLLFHVRQSGQTGVLGNLSTAPW